MRRFSDTRTAAWLDALGSFQMPWGCVAAFGAGIHNATPRLNITELAGVVDDSGGGSGGGGAAAEAARTKTARANKRRAAGGAGARRRRAIEGDDEAR